MCSLNQLGLSFFLVSTLSYGFFVALFRYDYTQTCTGDWGPRSPALRLKTGNGRCDLNFTLLWRMDNETLLNWGTFYDGEWKEGKKEGQGFYQSFAANQYQGQWKDDKRHGEGTFQLVDGSRWEGKWVNDSFTGKHNILRIGRAARKYMEAVDLLQDSYYIGEVLDGHMHGKGTLSLSLPGGDGGALKLEGLFQGGHFVGQGTVHLADGTSLEVENFEDAWQLSRYTAKATISSRNEENRTRFEWDGIKLVDTERGSVLEGVSKKEDDDDVMEEEENMVMRDLYNVLDVLKWFELHFEISQPAVCSDIYTFEYVDEESRAFEEAMQKMKEEENEEKEEMKKEKSEL